MDTIKDLMNTIDGFPMVVKILICLFVDIVWGLYRTARSVIAGNTTGIIIGVVLILCAPFMWIVDLVFLCMKGNIWTID